jgi:hypothetical protein
MLMKNFILILKLFFLLLITDTSALSCSIGRAACIVSCQAQNCATGYCINDDDDSFGLCKCNRCDIGTPWEF